MKKNKTQRAALRPISAAEQNGKNLYERGLSKNKTKAKNKIKKEIKFNDNNSAPNKVVQHISVKDEGTFETASLHALSSQKDNFYIKNQPQRVCANQTPSRTTKTSGLFNELKLINVNNNSYLVLKRIGKGGSSKVYKVMSIDSNIYALKIVDLSQANPTTMETFINEVELLRKLQNYDRIIKLIDSEVNQSKQQLSIVLELGDIDLRSLIDKNREEDEMVNPNFLRLMWQQMLEAVQIVHENSVIHGDLKPANFLFVKGTLKLIDFGIAKLIDVDANTTNIERFSQVGTLNYMSPEALKKNEEKGTFKCGRAADVWSLGCILYQLVYNKPPFPQASFVGVIQAIISEDYMIEFPPIDDRSDFVFLIDIMKKCLQRNPKSRPTIDELLKHPYLNSKEEGHDEEQIASKLLFFINFIQDYMDVLGKDLEAYDQAVTSLSEWILQTDDNGVDSIKHKLNNILRNTQV